MTTDWSGYALVALGLIAAIQGWATFGPWIYRKLSPAEFRIDFGEGTGSVSRKSATVGPLSIRVCSLSKRPIKVEQIFVYFSEQLRLQGFSIAGVSMPLSGTLPVIHRGGGRYRTIAAPTPIYFSKNDTTLADMVFQFPEPGDYEVRVRIWPAGEPVVDAEPMKVNVAP